MPRCLPLLLCLLSGCSQSFHYLGDALPPTDGAVWEKQPLATLLAVAGPPHRIASIPGGYVLGWESWRIKEQAVGVSLGFVGVDTIQIDWGDADVSGDFLLVTTDQTRTITSMARAKWSGDIGDAAALQPFSGLVPLVTVDDLLTPLPQHQWGASLLLPMPEAQNNASRPGMSGAGIEQRGTPEGIGQRALELH